jgi:hypothetical protein
MIFDIDQDMIMNTIMSAMNKAGEEYAQQIIERIDDSIPGVLELLINDSTEYWKETAIGKGGGWGEIYASAIKNKKSNNGGEIYIDENVKGKNNKPAKMFSEMVEKGVKSFSIKDALLASEKAKTSKDGIKYIIIPMPVHTPLKKGQGKMSSRFGGREMSADVYKIVKNGGRAPSGTLSTSGQDISGLTKFETRQFHSQYGIFRCVSQKSQGWQYPDKSPRPVFPSVIDYVNKRVAEIVDELCQAIVKEFDMKD